MANRTIRPGHEGNGADPPAARSLDLEALRAAFDGLRYGEVRVIVQDGVIVQIERLEKQRLR